MKLRVEAGDGDNESFVKIELWSNGAVLHTETLPASSTTPAFELDVDPTVDAYFFARVYEADGDELFSAPIYVDR